MNLANSGLLLQNHSEVKTGLALFEDAVAFGSGDAATDDARIVQRCRSGDQAGWDELVDRYKRLIYAIPRRAGLTDEQSADIFQEVFLTLFQKIDEIKQPERIRSWIVTTTKFKTWGVIRSAKGMYLPRTEEEMEAELAAIPDASLLADEMLIELEEQHLIRSALVKLEERCRRILSMIYLREPPASYAEVGAAIGVGETSVSPLRARCLKKLGSILTG